jgi:hypothetical protein
MSRLVPLTGSEASRTTKAASVAAGELHTTSDQQRVFFENRIVAPYWHGSVADETAMLRLANRHSGTGISAVDSDNSINDAGGFPGDWITGVILTVDGFTDPANNGTTFEISSRPTANKIIFTASAVLVDEAAGATITVTRNSKPGCWPGDKCKRTDIGTIWECVSNNGKVIGDWVEVTTDRIGTIRMWSGSIAALPTGYLLCDGTGGTPDLQDKFIQGKGAGTAIGDTGGAVNHKHALAGGAATGATNSASAGTPSGTIGAGGSHTHGFTQSSNAATPDLLAPDITATGVAAAGITDSDGSHSHSFTGDALAGHTHTALTGDTDNMDGRPPFYVLAFIKRVS